MKRFSLTLFLCLLACAVSGQEPPDFTSNEIGVGATDTTLVEIFLSNEGVVAYDTLGNSWVYDFRSDVFVLSDEPIASPSSPGAEDAIEPVKERCTEEKRISDWENEVYVRYDEYVNESIRAYGDVDVKGWVLGNVRSTTGTVTIHESGRVDGDVKAPDIIVRDGGIVEGQQVLTEPLDLPVKLFTDRFRTEGIWIVFGFTMFFLLSGFLVTSLAPKQVGRIEDCICCCPGKSVGWGFLVIPFAPVLLTLTVVGIVLLPLVPIAYLLALCIAMIVVGRKIDRVMSRKFFPGNRSLPYQGLLGILMFMSLWTMVAILLGSSNAAANGFGIFFLVASIVATSAVFVVGLGAALLTRFGFREYVPAVSGGATAPDDVPAPAPPPIMTAPSTKGPVSPSSGAGPLSSPTGPHSSDSDDQSDPHP